ncbi:aa3-type cytochrome oxidase subunit II [Mycolicibacterium litorale]|uniref:cytochrome-c oxidase n=1 Tax=Mycolicibacterium litorale TaxID=758802 RepID=A0AAD1MSN6_9MYCO|nr:cytochrome c oxidase subunit II [Mycolicibacterium litorale]MCV7414429.1 cytochrome c oxidase subunit II [Mycolicibacterium litorale]TDY01414.1 cytochrome c oxidase subunit 2 [Mycolicibacterium litorale]BBY15373.1 cytochrome c oxidase subunit II [Mycolicibacterium litorale]
MTPRGLKAVARKAALVVVLGATALVLSGCSWSDVLGLGWPKGITPEAHLNRELWIGSMIAALVVGGIVYVLIFWTSAFHRKKASDTELPRQFGYNMPLELALTVIPFLIISVLFYFTVVVQEQMLAKEDNPEVVVDVTAFQWNWKFGYNKVNFSDGTVAYDGADDERSAAVASRPGGEGAGATGEEETAHTEHGAIAGQNPEDRSYLAYDKVETLGTSTEIPVLVLPAGKRIEFRIASADVVHGFWVPEFLFKRDVLPNPQQNNSDNIFQISEIMETGAFVGRCTEMCGTYHAMMNFEVRVVEPNDFKAYMDQRIAGKTNAEALIAINQSPTAVTTRPFDTRRGEMAPQASR